MAKDVEAYLDELKSILAELSSGDLKLADAVELYRKGEQTARKAEKLLRGFEKEIEIICTDENGRENE